MRLRQLAAIAIVCITGVVLWKAFSNKPYAPRHVRQKEVQKDELVVYAGIPMRGTEDLDTFLPVVASIKYQTYRVDSVIAGVSGRKAVDNIAVALSLLDGIVLEDTVVRGSEGASRNLILRTAHNELFHSQGILIFGDSDDAWHPRRVEVIVQAFIDNPQAVAIVASYAYQKTEFCKWNKTGSLDAYPMRLRGKWSDSMDYGLGQQDHVRVDPNWPVNQVAHGPIAIRPRQCTSMLKWSNLGAGADREFMFRLYKSCGRGSVMDIDAPLICYKCPSTTVVARVLDNQAQDC